MKRVHLIFATIPDIKLKTIHVKLFLIPQYCAPGRCPVVSLKAREKRAYESSDHVSTRTHTNYKVRDFSHRKLNWLDKCILYLLSLHVGALRISKAKHGNMKKNSDDGTAILGAALVRLSTRIYRSSRFLASQPLVNKT